MNTKYIAGFFDGEGSAMVLTIKRKVSGRVIYRLRPTISIAQGTVGILKEIKSFLGYGTIQKSGDTCYKLQINGNKNVIRFVETVGVDTILKNKQLALLKELAIYQDQNFSNTPYDQKAMEHMVSLRDKVFQANTWTRSRIRQKYSDNQILQEHCFVNIDEWTKKRSSAGRNALGRYAKSIKKQRVKKECACGCGEILTTPDSKGREKRYVRGHNNRKRDEV
jgi:hypothetical protein